MNVGVNDLDVEYDSFPALDDFCRLQENKLCSIRAFLEAKFSIVKQFSEPDESREWTRNPFSATCGSVLLAFQLLCVISLLNSHLMEH